VLRRKQVGNLIVSFSELYNEQGNIFQDLNKKWYVTS
jgi:hypothetical protein